MRLVNKFLKLNNADELIFGEITKISLPNCGSRILTENANILYCTKFIGLEGLFRKDVEETFKYGRLACDSVKRDFNCDGFFTSDELPRYGINRKDIRDIFKIMDKKRGDGDLLIFSVYTYQKSCDIRSYLVKYFSDDMNSSEKEEITQHNSTVKDKIHIPFFTSTPQNPLV